MSTHRWDTSKQQHLQIDEEKASELISLPPVVSAYDAERLVESLTKFNIDEIGSKKWFEQHENLEKLNLQAHQHAMTNSDEYVLEAVLTFGKFDVLIHDLLIVEAWKENVFPKLLDNIGGKNTMRLYFVLYHEATLVNFFEILLYHKHVCEAGGDLMMELVDYTARKLTRIISGYDFRDCEPISDMINQGGSAKDISSIIEARTPQEELLRYFKEIEFRVCISTCSLGRFLCENAESLSLSVVGRITDTHDLLMLFIPIIENPPWTRRLKSGKWQKLIDNKWTEVLPIDLLKVTKLEGQPWLALYHLLAKKVRQ